MGEVSRNLGTICSYYLLALNHGDKCLLMLINMTTRNSEGSLLLIQCLIPQLPLSWSLRM